MSPGSGSNKRPTGAVPKTKPQRKNSVPQEMVAPTRRDLQEHLNEFFASVAERASKPDNTSQHHRSRTPAENCFDLENLTLQENTRFCWPVRPIPRRNFLHEDMNDPHSTIGQNSSGTNAAIGVVIPTTPNTSGLNHQQLHDHITNAYIANHNIRANQTPESFVDTANIQRAASVENGQQPTTNAPPVSAAVQISAANIEDRLNQIQEYIRITSSLINSIQTDKSSIEHIEDLATLSKNLDNLKDSEEKLLRLLSAFAGSRMVNNDRDGSLTPLGIMMNSNSLESVLSPTEPNGPRPQSVASIHSSIPNTPSYDDLNTKLDASNRHMFHIKEQQQQLLRLQQVAKSQLQEMEHIRGQYNQMSFAGTASGQPDYDNVDDVQNDVSALMNRMKSLTDFIHNQNELATMLGEDNKPGSEIMDEQLLLQRKLTELKNKKQQMANLVNELQGMNDDAKLKYQDRETTPLRNLTVEYERIVPIELVASSSRNSNSAMVQSGRYVVAPAVAAAKPTQPLASNSEPDEDEDDDDDVADNDNGGDAIEEEGAASINDALLGDKISEINAMKNQLNRLKEMMNTVKLIEIKNGDGDAEEEPLATVQRIGPTHFEAVAAAAANVAPVPSLAAVTTSVPIMYENVVPIHQTHQPFKPINKQPAPVVTTIPTTLEQPQRDDEGEMEERVRALHSMTQDLRLQAVTLSAERDRLKNIKNEIVRRNEDKDSNMKQNVSLLRGHKELYQHQQLQLQQQQEQEQLIKAQYEAKKKEFDKLVENLDVAGSLVAAAAEQSHLEKKESAAYYPEAWRRGQDVSSASSVHSGGRHSEPSTKPLHHNNSSGQNQGKDSADSGAADVLGMSVDAGSLQSGSSRGFSVPPPMRNIGARDSSAWRKTSQETSRISSLNQANVGFDAQHEHYPSWFYHNNYYNSGYNMGPPQSPHCHYHHGAGADAHYNCRAMFHAGAAGTGGTSNDPMLLQQFIQTQQMLINSVSQCNQLLWDQQREINNLNSAVLLLQERILNPSNQNNNTTLSDSMQTIRAESVPPNVTCTNTTAFLPRAQSEQPLAGGCFQSNYAGYLASANPNASSYRHYPFACQNHAQVYRNVQTSHNNSASAVTTTATGSNRVRYANNSSQLPVIQQRGELNHGYGYVNDNMQHMHLNGVAATAPTMLNNDPNSPLLNSAQHCQQVSPPIFIHHNNNTAGSSSNNNAAIINNQLHTQQNVAAASAAAAAAAAASTSGGSGGGVGATTNGNAYSSGAPALNNQVPPGNRANNYWDNFRSYSRQNLLSTNSCKSNEEACSSVNNSPHNRDHPNFPTGRNPPPNQMTHNILPVMGNKYLVHFRNQINQQNANSSVGPSTVPSTGAAPPDVLNVNQHHQHQQQQQLQHHQQLQQSNMQIGQQQQPLPLSPLQSYHQMPPPNQQQLQSQQHQHQQQQQQQQQTNDVSGHIATEIVTNYNNFNGHPQHQQIASTSAACSAGASNFNVNAAINLELNELKTKATKMLPKGSTGGSKRIRHVRDQNNLAAAGSTTCNNGVDLNLDSKSSEKLFESLKENVYLEVSALIAANESRPHFLINIFRELQLISTSDPLRNQLMQAFQELYNRYCEPSIQEENCASVQNDATPENPQHDSTQSSDNRFNQTSTESTPIRALDQQTSIDEELLRTIMLEVVEFLHDIDQIGESALQRITNIAVRHLTSPPTIGCHKANGSRYLISHDEFLRSMHNIDRHNRDLFLEGLESYLSSIFSATPGLDDTGMDKDYQHHAHHLHHHHHQHQQAVSQPPPPPPLHYVQPNRRPDCFIDAAAKSSNDILLSLRKKDEVAAANTLADVVVTIVDHVPTDDNEDLAEADQICNADDVYATEDDLAFGTEVGAGGGGGGMDEIGAVGGLVLSTLPDLAKVTATPTRNQMDDDSAMWMANAEVERLTGHVPGPPNDLAAIGGSGGYSNAHADLKPKNQ